MQTYIDPPPTERLVTVVLTEREATCLHTFLALASSNSLEAFMAASNEPNWPYKPFQKVLLELQSTLQPHVEPPW